MRDHLASRGIETAIHYPIPPHLSEAYSDHAFAGSGLKRTEELAKTVLSLPMNLICSRNKCGLLAAQFWNLLTDLAQKAILLPRFRYTGLN